MSYGIKLGRELKFVGALPNFFFAEDDSGALWASFTGYSLQHVELLESETVNGYPLILVRADGAFFAPVEYTNAKDYY